MWCYFLAQNQLDVETLLSAWADSPLPTITSLFTCFSTLWDSVIIPACVLLGSFWICQDVRFSLVSADSWAAVFSTHELHWFNQHHAWVCVQQGFIQVWVGKHFHVRNGVKMPSHKRWLYTTSEVDNGREGARGERRGFQGFIVILVLIRNQAEKINWGHSNLCFSYIQAFQWYEYIHL